MKTYLPISMFFIVEIIVVPFILSSSGVLPENIASHFNGTGVPNGCMSKEGYIQFILLFAVGIPTLTVGSISFAMSYASGTINIPNKEYWLTLTTTTPDVCAISNNTSLAGITAGSCSIVASQIGNDSFNAVQTTKSIIVGFKIAPMIVLSGLNTGAAMLVNADGKVMEWPWGSFSPDESSDLPRIVPGLDQVTSVCLDANHYIKYAVNAHGTVYVWGALEAKTTRS